METKGAKPAISDLPLDLFGDAEAPIAATEPEPIQILEPAPELEGDGDDTRCIVCGAPLTAGFSTCVHCGAQNDPIPVLSSIPQSVPAAGESPQRSGSYVGRVAFAFVYIARDILRAAAGFTATAFHEFLDWMLLGHRSRGRHE